MKNEEGFFLAINDEKLLFNRHIYQYHYHRLLSTIFLNINLWLLFLSTITKSFTLLNQDIKFRIAVFAEKWSIPLFFTYFGKPGRDHNIPPSCSRTYSLTLLGSQEVIILFLYLVLEHTVWLYWAARKWSHYSSILF